MTKRNNIIKIYFNTSQDNTYISSIKPPYSNSDYFYAVNPMERPIPKGMVLISVERSGTFLNRVVDVYAVSDTFEDKKNNVYFITHTKPIKNSTKLYVYEDTLSFKKLKNRKESAISPLYVFTDKDALIPHNDKNKITLGLILTYVLAIFITVLLIYKVVKL